MPSLKTRSTAAKSLRTIIFTFIPLFALAFLGLRVAVITWLFLKEFCCCALAFVCCWQPKPIEKLN